MIYTRPLLAIACSWLLMSSVALAGDLKVATFELDATPPLGTPISYASAKEVMDPLSCRGIVLVPEGHKVIVLVAVDWIRVANGAHDAFRAAVAGAAGTDPQRVAVHVLHQHDAPGYDFTSETLQKEAGHPGFPADYCRDTIVRTAVAVKEAMSRLRPVTHMGAGIGRVEKVASNRRVIGPDRKVLFNRFSSGTHQFSEAAPEGLIDPDLRMIALYQGDEPLVALTWYATHPQSYYTRGSLSADFVGLARNRRQQQTGIPHIHFNGAGGNITAGKYNKNSPVENRAVLMERLADGMKRAWESLQRTTIDSDDVAWRIVPVALPPSPLLDEVTLAKNLAADGGGAGDLAWLRRCNAGHKIDLTCLQLGEARVLHMPGELFIEYQIAAQRMRPDDFVAMAAYGDGGPGYIGTTASYPQGGYEVGGPSNVAPEVEKPLVEAMMKLLEVDNAPITPSQLTATYPVFDPGG